MNTTRMHVFTHVRESMRGQSGMPGNEYADGMIEHDGDVGKLLKALDDLGIANNTIVVYTTDNGPNQWSWPDAATTPFRSEKDTNWEGAFRVPAMVRWPGHIKAGEVSNEMISGLDWFPTLLAAAGDTDIKDRLLKGTDLGGKTFKVHLDGYNQLPYLTGKAPKCARNEFYYFNDDGELVAYRYDDWKIVFCEQREPGGFEVWSNPFTCLRVPKVFNLRMDPFERADIVSDQYYDWLAKNAYLLAIRCLAGGSVPADLQGVSAEPAVGELQHRPDGRSADEDAGQGSARNSATSVSRLSRSRWTMHEPAAALWRPDNSRSHERKYVRSRYDRSASGELRKSEAFARTRRLARSEDADRKVRARPGSPGREHADRAARQRQSADRKPARPCQDARGEDAGKTSRGGSVARAVHAGPAAVGCHRRGNLSCRPTRAVSSSSRRVRSSPTSCWPTRSTARRPRCSRRCSRRWKSARSRSPARPTRCPICSWCWPPRTRSSRKAPIRCRKRSSIAS